MRFSLFVIMCLSSLGIGVAYAETGAPIAGETVDPIIKGGVVFASLSALIWALRHLLTVTIPRQEARLNKQEERHENLAASFRDTLDKIMERAEQHDLRFTNTLQSITKDCEERQRRWMESE